MVRLLPLLVLPLACAACAPATKLAIAPTILSESWRAAPEPVGVAGQPSPLSWQAFGSGELDQLLARARASNTDIAIAAARIVQARGQLRLARAAGSPTVSVGASGEATRQNIAGLQRSTQSLQIGPEISWEVDLFGAASAGKRSARARLSAAEFDRDAVALLVESEVARAYFDHAALGDRINLVDRSLANARELERIIRVRMREGVATRVDTGLQTVEVRRIEAERSKLVEAREHAVNALALLVGEEAPRFAVAGTRLDQLSAPAFRPGQPADLLVRRADVRAAEARIAAAEGDVAQARAAFLPSLTLSAQSLLDLGSGGPAQLVGSVGGDLLAPIFGRGRLKGRLLSASGAQQESVESYRAVLLTAVRDAEDALTACREAGLREALLAATIEEARLTATLARRQFDEGAADLQTVLDAERSLLLIEQDHALALQDRLNAAVRLIAAMGGWPEVQTRPHLS